MGKAPPSPQFRTRKGTGAVVLTGIDGRSLLARRFREIATGIESDLATHLAVDLLILIEQKIFKLK